MREDLIRIVGKYDESLNKEHTENYSLSIQFTPDGFSFCVFNNITLKYLLIESVSWQQTGSKEDFAEAFESHCRNHEWLSRYFSVTEIYYEADKSTLVPAPLYDSRERNSLAGFNFQVEESHMVLSDKINHLDAYLLYPIPEILVKKFLLLFPQHKLFSHLSRLIEILFIQYKNLAGTTRMFVNVRKTSLDMIVINGNKLLYCNSFNYRSPEDFIYFVIFVLEQLSINPEETELFLSGLIERNSKLFEILHRYIRHIQFLSLSDKFNYSYIFNEIPRHHYFTLINARLCES